MGLSPVTFYDLRYDQNNRSPIIFLKDSGSDRFLPVWIGDAEAQSIDMAHRGVQAQRPLTHDLIKRIFDRAGIRVVSVIIDRLIGSTYYANLVLDIRGESVEIDCRPSDAIALALREKVQIFVATDLMYNIKFVEMAAAAAAEENGEGETAGEDSPAFAGEPDEEDFRRFLRALKPEDFKEG
jgi:bifunctional DNase/RNase